MKSRPILGTMVILLLGLCAVQCGGGDSTLNLSGTWNLKATLTQNSCGLPNVALNTVQVTVTQSGSSVMISGGGITATGTVSGNTLTISNGSLNVTNLNRCLQVTFSLSGSGSDTSVSGTFTGNFSLFPSLTCSGTSQSCTGTATFTMTKA